MLRAEYLLLARGIEDANRTGMVSRTAECPERVRPRLGLICRKIDHGMRCI